MRPELSPAQRHVLAATIALHATEGRVTVRAVAAELDLGVSTVHRHLQLLRLCGLVATGAAGTATLHPHPHLVLVAGQPCAAIPIGGDR